MACIVILRSFCSLTFAESLAPTSLHVLKPKVNFLACHLLHSRRSPASSFCGKKGVRISECTSYLYHAVSMTPSQVTSTMVRPFLSQVRVFLGTDVRMLAQRCYKMREESSSTFLLRAHVDVRSSISKTNTAISGFQSFESSRHTRGSFILLLKLFR